METDVSFQQVTPENLACIFGPWSQISAQAWISDFSPTKSILTVSIRSWRGKRADPLPQFGCLKFVGTYRADGGPQFWIKHLADVSLEELPVDEKYPVWHFQCGSFFVRCMSIEYQDLESLDDCRCWLDPKPVRYLRQALKRYEQLKWQVRHLIRSRRR